MSSSNSASNWDAIVVGSGAGGAAATWRLAQAGLRVLLLEKGEDLPRDGSTLDTATVVHAGRFNAREPWRDRHGGLLTPEEHFNLGGKTRWYGAALLRFGAHEFAADPEHQCRAWPIDLEQLRPHYAQAERLLGVRTYDVEPALARITARVGARASGWAVAPLPLALAPGILVDPHEARHFDGFASVAGLKGDAVRGFLDAVRLAPGLTVRTGEAVTGLVGAVGRPTTIIGVRTDRGATYCAPHVLLAAGALHTPRLVQDYVAHNGLAAALPAACHVGRNLKLHLLTALVAVGTRRPPDLIRKTRVFTHAEFAHSSVQPLGFDGELIGTLIPRIVPRVLARQIGDRAYGFFLQTEDGSHPDNRVVAASDGGAPLIDYDEARVAPARDEHRRLVRRFTATMARCGLLAFSKRIGLAGTAHACGTMIAGRDPADSVVDAEGRMHGINGLYVVDGSVLPRSSRVNPSLSIYGWSLRVAEHIALAHRVSAADVMEHARA